MGTADSMLTVESSSLTPNLKMADPGKTPEAAIPWDFSRDDADPVPGQSDDGPGPSLSEDNPEPGENDDGPVPDENNGDQKHLHGEWSDMTCRE